MLVSVTTRSIARLLGCLILSALITGCGVSLSYSQEEIAPWFRADDLNGKRFLIAPCPDAFPTGWGVWPRLGSQPTAEDRNRDRWIRHNLAAHFYHEFKEALSASVIVDTETAGRLAARTGSRDVPATVQTWLPVASDLQCDYLAVVQLEELSRHRDKTESRNYNTDGEWETETTYKSAVTLVTWLYIFRTGDGELAYRVRGCGRYSDAESETDEDLPFEFLLACILFPPLFLLLAIGSADYPDYCDPHDILRELSEGILSRLPQVG